MMQHTIRDEPRLNKHLQQDTWENDETRETDETNKKKQHIL